MCWRYAKSNSSHALELGYFVCKSDTCSWWWNRAAASKGKAVALKYANLEKHFSHWSYEFIDGDRDFAVRVRELFGPCDISRTCVSRCESVLVFGISSARSKKSFLTIFDWISRGMAVRASKWFILLTFICWFWLSEWECMACCVVCVHGVWRDSPFSNRSSSNCVAVPWLKLSESISMSVGGVCRAAVWWLSTDAGADLASSALEIILAMVSSIAWDSSGFWLLVDVVVLCRFDWGVVLCGGGCESPCMFVVVWFTGRRDDAFLFLPEVRGVVGLGAVTAFRRGI